MSETWAIGYTVRDFDMPEIHIDDDGHIETKFHYAYYRDFEEAKDAMLSILGACGMDMIRNNIPHDSIVHMAQATIEFMHLTKEDYLRDRADQPMICDVDGVMGFFIMNREVKANESKREHLTFELVADHRNCTEGFCFGENIPNPN